MIFSFKLSSISLLSGAIIALWLKDYAFKKRAIVSFGQTFFSCFILGVLTYLLRIYSTIAFIGFIMGMIIASTQTVQLIKDGSVLIKKNQYAILMEWICFVCGIVFILFNSLMTNPKNFYLANAVVNSDFDINLFFSGFCGYNFGLSICYLYKILQKYE
jgi:hypothetical protein